MAGTSGSSRRRLKESKLSGTFWAVGGAAQAREIDHATPSLPSSTRSVEEQIERSKAHWSVLAEPDAIPEEHEPDHETAPASTAVAATKPSYSSSVEEQIERSKAHWSTLADQSGCMEGEEVAEVSNLQEFQALQLHPTWGNFFRTFNGDDNEEYDDGELVVGKKFAEGGQAELYEAQVRWRNPEYNEKDMKEGSEYALKVLKKGTFLKHLKTQFSQGALRLHARAMHMKNLSSPVPRFICKVHRGTVLNDGRIAFLMQKEHFDLRALIEANMKLRRGKYDGPFPKEEAEYMMYCVALGVDWLHSRDIVHRDLKASNVLVRGNESAMLPNVFVADYECSGGVVGTGFFRAPEILRVCKEGETSQRLETVFSKATDLYSYGMTCYEIMVGKLPFEDHPLSGNSSLLIDLVINQHLRPEVPEYVEGWTRELLNRCWHFDPTARPTIGEIMNLLVANSAQVREYEKFLKGYYGENFRPNLKLPDIST